METLSPGHSKIIFEGFLHKTPPLDKLFVNWKRRWFVLSRSDPFDLSSVVLSYYTDPMKQEKKRSIPLSEVIKIHPSFSKAKDHSFAIELKDQKFLLKAPDVNSKNVWVAKLCELSFQDQSYHVTVPFQPSAVAAEASLKLATPGAVSVVVPSTGKPIMEFPFKRIRRFGYQVLYGADVVWFETCECNREAQEDFQYFVVNSGMEVACQIIHEFKTKIEQATGAFLIMEKADDTEVTYKARAHYGHKEFPPIIRARVLQVGLAGLNQTWPIASGSSFAEMRGRRQSEFSQRATQSSTEQGRRTTVMALLGIGGKSQTPSPKHSPSPLPTHSPSSSPTPSPNHSGGKFTLDQMAAYHRSPRSSKSHQGSKSDQFDSGVTLDVFDEARHSAPSYIPMTATPSIQKSLTRTLPSTPSPPMRHKSSLERFSKQHGATIDVPSSRPPPIPSRRVTLDHLTDKIHHMEPTSPKGPSPRTFPSKDSTLGSADFEFEGVHSSNGIVNGKQHKQAHSNAYDHLQQNQGHSKGYDHLPERSRRHSPVVPPRSLHSLHNSPYVES